MKIRLIILLVSCMCLISCEKRKFIVLVEQPTDINLDNVNLKLILDDDQANFFVTTLKYSDITPRFVSSEFFIDDKRDHSLNIYIQGKKINCKLSYPNDKYIILSPFYKDKDIIVGIIKKSEKFNLD